MNLSFILVLGKLIYISCIMDTERLFVFFQDFYLVNNYIYWVILFWITYFYYLKQAVSSCFSFLFASSCQNCIDTVKLRLH